MIRAVGNPCTRRVAHPRVSLGPKDHLRAVSGDAELELAPVAFCRGDNQWGIALS